MPQERIAMRRIRDLLRYYYGEGHSQRLTARYVELSRAAVQNYLARAKAAGLTWPLPDGLTDEELEVLLFPEPVSMAGHPQPDWADVENQLAEKHMTLERVWNAYHKAHPGGYSYGHFCALYKDWKGARKVVMRLHHKAGDKLFVDFAGTTVEVLSRVNGEVMQAQIFVATLGCSNYTYVEATPDQKIRSWIGAHVRALAFFGAVPKVVVCDNLKAAVTKPHPYHPKLNAIYSDLARHYELAVLPARVRRPQDKSLVEGMVKMVGTRILTSLRGRQFFSIKEVNDAIAPLLEELNNRPFQKKPGTRRSQFEELDRPAMQPLPAEPYAIREWKKAKVSIDYHVHVNNALYSVPHAYARKQVDVCITDHMVECFYKGKRIAIHERQHEKGSRSTNAKHMTKGHRQYLDRMHWLKKARAVGAHAEKMAEVILDSRAHPELGYRSIMGILRLGDTYTKERLNAACKVALSLGTRACNHGSVASILKTNRDRVPQTEIDLPPVQHENLRGGDYYDSSKKD